MHRQDSKVRHRHVVAVVALLAAGLIAPTPAAVAADAMPMSASSEANSRLREIFGGKPLSGLSDLKAMQNHLRTLTEQIKKCTVGVQVGPAWGSGVIVSKDGYVLTAAHVAGRPNITDCRVRLADGKEVRAVTLGLYRTLDAGLMKITDSGEWPHAEIADSRKLGYGQWCVAMGHPGGYQEDRGAVLRLGQVLSVSDDAITTNCTLVGGDSGGPLFDMDGRVIGINSRIAEQFYNNMHVPVSAYRERNAWDRLVKGEAWGHLPGQDPWLGVSGDTEVSASPQTKGARITKVTEKSPAERAGLLVGDLVTAFDSREIADFQALRQAVDDCRPNESVVLTVRRGNEQLNVRVRLGRKPE
jgi:serine protease Do